MYSQEEIQREFVKRLTTKALEFIVDNPNIKTMDKCEEKWFKLNPKESMFLSGYIPKQYSPL